MHVHAMRFVVEGQGLIMMDGSPQIGSHGPDASQRVVLYICMCVLFLFLCYNKGNHMMDAMFLPVCAHLYPDVCVYLGQLI
jgi:hypothetical protein